MDLLLTGFVAGLMTASMVGVSFWLMGRSLKTQNDDYEGF